MPKLKSINDKLIYDLLKDESFEIKDDGTIWRHGRKKGRKDKEGYIEVYYKGRRLKAHRIVYAKFKGELNKELVVDHKDTNPTNNDPGNLRMCTQGKNIYYRDRRKRRTGKA